MEYSAALEEKANAQAERIIQLNVSVDGQIFLTDTMDYATIGVATGTNKELNKIQATMKQLEASVTAQEATVETLSTKMNRGSGGTVKTTDKKKARPGLHV